LPFDQAEDEQGQADYRDPFRDPAVVVQEHRCHGQRACERAVAALDGFLALVAAQHFGRVDVGGQVGEQGVPAVGGCLVVQRILAEGPG
jgi:hypothetical protein